MRRLEQYRHTETDIEYVLLDKRFLITNDHHFVGLFRDAKIWSQRLILLFVSDNRNHQNSPRISILTSISDIKSTHLGTSWFDFLFSKR
jgi:hypothetical protein